MDSTYLSILLSLVWIQLILILYFRDGWYIYIYFVFHFVHWFVLEFLVLTSSGLAIVFYNSLYLNCFFSIYSILMDGPLLVVLDHELDYLWVIVGAILT